MATKGAKMVKSLTEPILAIAVSQCSYPRSLSRIGSSVQALKRLRASRYVAALFNKARKAAEAGDYAAALVAVEHLLDQAPEIGEVWGFKGDVLRSLGRHAEALAAIEHALELTSGSGPLWLAKGIHLHELGRYEEALTAGQRALELDEKDADAWVLKADLLGRLGRYEDALQASHQAVMVAPDKALAWYSKGIALFNLGQYAEALEANEKSLALEPGSADTWTNKGDTLTFLGRHTEALRAFDHALQLKPKEGSAWAGKGAALYFVGRVREAMDWLDRGVDVVEAVEGRGKLYRVWGGLTLAEASKAMLEHDHDAIDDRADQWGYIVEQARAENLGQVVEESLATFKASLSREVATRFARLEKKLRLMEDRIERFKALQESVTRHWPPGLSVVDAVREGRR